MSQTQTFSQKNTQTSNRPALATALVAILLRLWLFNTIGLRSWLQNRPEISTPLTSWNRVLEGLSLQNSSTSAYEGDLVHELPMMLYFYKVLVNSPVSTKYLFVLIDLLNSVLVYLAVKKAIQVLHYTEKLQTKTGKYNLCLQSVPNTNQFFLNSISFSADLWPLIAFGVYLFNPFCIACCVSQSTVLVHNFFLLLWFVCLLNNQTNLACLFLSIHANCSVYSTSLCIASAFFLLQQNSSKSHKNPHRFLAQKLLLFACFIFAVFALNLWLEDFNIRFIKCTYLFVLQVPDLVPNLGVFWYFFTEMFDHFRLFFIYVFQFNVLLYALPISLRLRDDPIISLLLQLGLISTLKSYPNVGETGLFLSLLPMAAFLFPLLRNFLVYSCMLVASVILAPIMFYMWVGSGGGNANFYFAITLVYSVGLIFLIVDLFYALLKREFIKLNGANVPMSKNGQPALFHLE